MSTKHIRSKLRSSLRIKFLILFLTIILIVMMFPKGESIESGVTVGSVWIHEDLIASTTFEILKDSKVFEREKFEAAQKILPIFLKDTRVEKLYIDSLRKYNLFFTKALGRNTGIENNKTFLSDQSFSIYLQLKNQPLSLKGVKVHSLSEVLSFTEELLQEIYQRGFLNLFHKKITRDSIALRIGKFEKISSILHLFDSETLNDYLNSRINNRFGKNSALNEAIDEYISNFIKPNLIYSYELTDAAIKNAKEKVPRNVGIVNENERIVAKHDRISPEIKMKIDSYRIAKGEESGLAGKFAQNFGKHLHIFLVLLPFIIYIYLFRKKIYLDNLKIVLIASIILFISFLTYLVYQVNVASPIDFLVLVPAASMLLTIIFDSRIGFYGTVVISLIVGALRGNDYVFTVINIIAGSIGAYTVRDIKKRTQIFRSFLFILLGYLLSIIAFGFERFDSLGEMLSSFIFASSNALISPVITYGLIIFIEKFFNITTDLTLIELTDVNSTLLKDLAKNAPGTFNHSIALGTLAEKTAEAIGANPVLARVGAYYHDIGKLIDPDVFVENQMNSTSLHEDLPPEKSAQLIISHVKKGIELAEQNDLPQEIIDFIPMHHGTIVVSYFYEKAKELYGAEKVDVKDYRYAGPKPNTKETAIVMLADACESTIRSLSDADPHKIENVINNLINSRIEDSQLDEAPLTFNDVRKIKESFLSILVGHHHKRIRYPHQEELEKDKLEE